MDIVIRVALLAIVPLAFALPAADARRPDAAGKPRCHFVVKKVHGHKKRVRVCTKPKPEPKPKPPASTIKRIDIGGYKLAIECRGKGTPAIVLDSGFDTSRGAWTGVLTRISVATRVCSYDRAGLGQSGNRPAGIAPTTARVVDELHTLLGRAGLSPPYILGGWSIGGFDVRYYAKRFPAEVAALVLVDATPPTFLPEEINGSFETMLVGAAARELEPPPELGSLPLAVLTHGVPSETDQPEWFRDQKRIARSSTKSILIRADTSDHDIPGTNPALIALALKIILGDVRGGAPLQACSTYTGLAPSGGTCLDPAAPR